MRRWTKVVLIVGGLSVFFLLDELLVLFVLREAFPKTLRHSLVTIVIGCAGVLSVLVAWLVFKALRRKPATGREGLIGEIGEALTDLDPRGEILVAGEYWKAKAQRKIDKGRNVRVTAVSRMLLDVEPAD